MITDVAALRAAVDELKRRGMKISLEQNTTPRAYFSNQQGMGEADYVVQLHDASYDVGLYKKDKGYEARTDFWGGSVEKVLGVNPKEGENADQARLGKLYQMYAVCAAEQQAFRQGYNPRRVELSDGTIQLQMEVA
jgi:hypothetical protein